MRHSFSDLLNLPHVMVTAWKWLLEKHQLLGKHFLRLGIVLVQKRQLTVLNLPEPIFTLVVTQVKIVVIEPAKSITARCFR